MKKLAINLITPIYESLLLDRDAENDYSDPYECHLKIFSIYNFKLTQHQTYLTLPPPLHALHPGILVAQAYLVATSAS